MAKKTEHAEDVQTLKDDAAVAYDADVAAAQEPPPAPRCDCTALNVPHTHEKSGPVPLSESPVTKH
jgi:hypothetical protein